MFWLAGAEARVLLSSVPGGADADALLRVSAGGSLAGRVLCSATVRRSLSDSLAGMTSPTTSKIGASDGVLASLRLPRH